MIKESLFYAKILLFGEYGIIDDSMGLSIPYNMYQGKLLLGDLKEPNIKDSNDHLKNFYTYLKNLAHEETLLAKLQLDLFKQDIDNGMHFESSIPQGFGIGSSGALCAAIYDKYAIDKINPEKSTINNKDILELKKILGQMESHFHGKSSGLDPLICYLNLPVLIKSKSEVGVVGMPETIAEGKGAIFLLNSGKPGSTQSMVSIFLEKFKQEGFRNIMKEQFKKYNDACIDAFLNRDISPLFKNIKKLSKLLLENFTPMIPSIFHQLWEEGIKSNSYYLKLCGSGGGGYILGFTKDIEKARKKLQDYQLEVIYNF